MIFRHTQANTRHAASCYKGPYFEACHLFRKGYMLYTSWYSSYARIQFLQFRHSLNTARLNEDVYAIGLGGIKRLKLHGHHLASCAFST